MQYHFGHLCTESTPFHTFHLGKWPWKTFFQLPSGSALKGHHVAHKHLVSISLLARYQSHNSLRKNQPLENALSHHIISAALLPRGRRGPNGNALSATVDTRSLSLCLLFHWFLAPGPILAATVPRLAARPWPPLTNGAERRFRVSKEERGSGGRECVWGIGVRHRQTGESFTVRHHFKSWVYSSKSIWALQRSSARLKPDLPAAPCLNRHVQWQTSTPSPTLLFAWMGGFFLSLCHIVLQSTRGVQPSWSSCCRLKHATYNVRNKVREVNSAKFFYQLHWHQALHFFFPPHTVLGNGFHCCLYIAITKQHWGHRVQSMHRSALSKDCKASAVC